MIFPQALYNLHLFRVYFAIR